MTEEYFDLVNERDKVIGSAPRREVHRRGLRHRAVHVLIFNAQGEVFLQKRSPTKDCHPDIWDSSASGHLVAGEDYDAATVREVAEELGIVLATPPQRLFKLAAGEATGQEFVWVYRATAEGPFTLHPEEISEGGWFALGHVSRWLAARPADFSPTVPLIWGRLFPTI